MSISFRSHFGSRFMALFSTSISIFLKFKFKFDFLVVPWYLKRCHLLGRSRCVRCTTTPQYRRLLRLICILLTLAWFVNDFRLSMAWLLAGSLICWFMRIVLRSWIICTLLSNFMRLVYSRGTMPVRPAMNLRNVKRLYCLNVVALLIPLEALYWRFGLTRALKIRLPVLATVLFSLILSHKLVEVSGFWMGIYSLWIILIPLLIVFRLLWIRLLLLLMSEYWLLRINLALVVLIWIYFLLINQTRLGLMLRVEPSWIPIILGARVLLDLLLCLKQRSLMLSTY